MGHMWIYFIFVIFYTDETFNQNVYTQTSKKSWQNWFCDQIIYNTEFNFALSIYGESVEKLKLWKLHMIIRNVLQ